MSCILRIVVRVQKFGTEDPLGKTACSGDGELWDRRTERQHNEDKI